MVCHLTDALRMVSGQLRVAPKNLPIRFTPLKQLIIYCMPFPKGAPTAPELRARQPTEWQGEVAMLRTELEALVTRGAAGALLVHEDGSLETIPGVPTGVVDSTGAGDAFTSALAVALAEGQALTQAVTFATYAGALTCTRLGVIPALPYRQDVEALMASTWQTNRP